ncbi:sterol desaturase family protein [Kitasatospora sp. NPDC051914]|uniref:sterol desaturase family protein n=1 Tax=Kitasatospora sp. NPDC051914 TaxID=3154945 RepID=UPI003419A4F0
MDGFLGWVGRLGAGEVVAGALVFNVGLLVAALLAGGWLVRRYGYRRVAPVPGPVTAGEAALVAVAVLLNSAVGVAGWALWKAGWITVSTATGPGALLELAAFTLVMDALMYAAHWIAHRRRLYRLAHEMHHRFPDPRPATLFALHPLEVAGFGGAWLAVLMVWELSVPALGGYLVLNLVFGLLGHLGVEPLPARVRRWPLFRWVALPMFHVGHHLDASVNFGFYTTVWDRLFGTVDPAYDRMRHAADPAAVRLPDGLQSPA